MSELTDRVSYLKGLAEGLKLNTETNEGKLIEKMLELMGAMAEEIADQSARIDELNEYAENIDSDLGDLEDAVLGEEDDEEECDHHCRFADDEDDDEDESIVEYTCPHCGEMMTFEVENFDFDEDYLCPNCHKPLFPEAPDED